MKVFKSVPDFSNEIFHHEGPMAKRAVKAAMFFVIISAITVTMAWRVFLWDSISFLGVVLAWAIVIILGIALALPIERFIFEASSYVWRSIFTNRWKGEHTFQFVTASVILLALMLYSFTMSQRGTKSAMLFAAPEIAVTETTDEVSDQYDRAVRANARIRMEESSAVNSRYDREIAAINATWKVVIDSVEAEILHYRQLEERTGNKYTTKLNRLRRAADQAKADRARAVQVIETKRSEELSLVDSKKMSADSVALAEKSVDRSQILTDNSRTREINQMFASVFSNIIAWIAALSVVFVFCLAGWLENFYHRAQMRNKVVLSADDLQPSLFAEIIEYPVEYVKRHLVKWVREAYKRLPDVQPPLQPDTVYDTGGLSNHVKTTSGSAPSGSVPTPPPATPPILHKPSSLPDSTLETGGMRLPVSVSLPEGLEEKIVEAFRTPVESDLFYKKVGMHPSEFQFAWDYLQTLKKRARNTYRTAMSPNKPQSTRMRNQDRFKYMRLELGRMYVQSTPGGGKTLNLEWTTDRTEYLDEIQKEFGN